MKVPFLDLKIQYQTLKKEVQAVVNDVFENTAFVGGKQVSLFEQNFANYCNTKYCLGLNSGTDALKFALLALGIKEGDEVITVANTFIATTEVISQIGAKIVFVDIDEKTYNIDVSKIREKITSKTKAIIPVHLYGQCADMDEILKIAKEFNLSVIEDASQAHGAKYKTLRAGSMGDISAFSFYPGKNLGAYGDGGAIVSNNKKLIDYSLMLRNHGQKEKYYHEIEGYNSRLDTVQAGILDIKLKYLDSWNSNRRKIAHYYNELLKNTEIITPFEPEFSEAVYHLYIVRLKNRDEVKKKLLEKGIETGLHYPLPLHLQNAYKHLNYVEGSLPITEKVSKEILSLPIYPELTLEQVEYVVKELKAIIYA